MQKLPEKDRSLALQASNELMKEVKETGAAINKKLSPQEHIVLQKNNIQKLQKSLQIDEKIANQIVKIIQGMMQIYRQAQKMSFA